MGVLWAPPPPYLGGGAFRSLRSRVECACPAPSRGATAAEARAPTRLLAEGLEAEAADHAVALLEPLAAGADLHDLARDVEPGHEASRGAALRPCSEAQRADTPGDHTDNKDGWAPQEGDRGRGWQGESCHCLGGRDGGQRWMLPQANERCTMTWGCGQDMGASLRGQGGLSMKPIDTRCGSFRPAADGACTSGRGPGTHRSKASNPWGPQRHSAPAPAPGRPPAWAPAPFRS